MKTTKRLRAALLAGVMAVTIAPGAAMANEDSMTNEAGIGALAAVSSLLYAPVKLVYATCGLVFGGVAWGLSGGDHDVMHAVITPSVRGDYVVTPQHLRNERPLEFFGSDPHYRVPQTAAMVREEPVRVHDPVVVQEDF